MDLRFTPKKMDPASEARAAKMPSAAAPTNARGVVEPWLRFVEQMESIMAPPPWKISAGMPKRKICACTERIRICDQTRVLLA